MTATADLDLGTAIRPTHRGIAHLLRDQRLVVPPFQRSYSWKLEQVEAFWNDLREASLQPSPDYFLGTIVLTPDAQRGRMRIIDGQQRLATTVMLLATIRNEFLAAGDSERAAVIEKDYIASRSLRSAQLEPRLELNDEDRSFFTSLVVRPESGSSASPTLESHRRIAKAFGFLTDRLEEERGQHGSGWPEYLFSWIDFLDQRARAIVVVVSNEADAFATFETLNDRGLEMTIADLLKNYLFSLARDDVKPMQRQWLEMLSVLDAEEDQELTDFLRYFWSSHHGATRERDLYKALRRRVRDASSAARLVAQLRDAAVDYSSLLSAESEHWSESRSTRSAMELTLRLGLKQHRPLLLAAMQELDQAEFRELLIANIGWSVRGLVVGGIGGGTTERYYADAAVRVRSGKATTTTAIFRFLSPIIPGDEDFAAAFSQFSPGRVGLARYLLAALNRAAEGKKVPSLVSDVADAEVELQHILPRSADADEWPAFDEDSIRTWSRRLGNLVLLKRDEDVRLAGSWPVRRKVLATADLEITSSVGRVAEWSPKAIASRQRALAEQAVQTWPREP